MAKTKVIIFDIFGVICSSFNAEWERKNLSDKPELQATFKELSNAIDLGEKHQPDFYHTVAKVLGVDAESIKHEAEPAGFQMNEKLLRVYPNRSILYG
jgi:hypothetical protein